MKSVAKIIACNRANLVRVSPALQPNAKPPEDTGFQNKDKSLSLPKMPRAAMYGVLPSMCRLSSFLLLASFIATGCRTTQNDGYSELHSDHIDGPATTAHAITDLVDLFVFPSTDRMGSITIVLNVHPLSREHNHFSDKVDYSIYMRKVDVKNANGKVEFDAPATSEKTVTCKFSTPHDHARHTMTCSGPGIGARTVFFNDIPVVATNNAKLRLYHGLRSDPFFFYGAFAEALAKEGKEIPPKNENIMRGTNALSIVLEVNPKDIFGEDVGLLALVAQSHTKNTQGEFQPLDRLGRPEVTNVTMVARQPDADLREFYNLEKPFELSEHRKQLYGERIVKNLGHYDAIDGKIDWSAAQKREYAGIIVNDFLLIDASKTNTSPAEYFAIESGLLAGKPRTSFGGRRLQDDIMDRIFGILINRNGPPIVDGVDKPEQPISSQFPYLAAPDKTWYGWLKANLARWNLGSAGNP